MLFVRDTCCVDGDALAIDHEAAHAYCANTLPVLWCAACPADRKSFGDTKTVEESAERLGRAVAYLDNVKASIDKGAFLDARSGLRRAVGTLRYDINKVRSRPR